jgi:hypothetical protein
MNEILMVMESAQRLANQSEQKVAIYTLKGKLDYDVIGALEKNVHVLEILHPEW